MIFQRKGSISDWAKVCSLQCVGTVGDSRDHAGLLFGTQAVERRDPSLNGVTFLLLDRAQDAGVKVVVARDAEGIDHEGHDIIAHALEFDLGKDSLFVSRPEVVDVLGDSSRGRGAICRWRRGNA